MRLIEEPAPALPDELIAALAAVAGADGMVTDPNALIVYESDGLASYRARPRAVVLPRNTTEVAAIVRILAAADIPFVAQGRVCPAALSRWRERW